MVEYNGKKVIIMCCSSCNLSCEHCYISYEGNRTAEDLLDVVRNLKDKYNRYLAWVYTDGTLLQSELVEKGFAKVAYVYGNYEYTDELKYGETIDVCIKRILPDKKKVKLTIV